MVVARVTLNLPTILTEAARILIVVTKNHLIDVQHMRILQNIEKETHSSPIQVNLDSSFIRQ